MVHRFEGCEKEREKERERWNGREGERERGRVILCLSALRMEKFWFSRRRRRRRFVSSKAVSDDARSNVEKSL